MLALGAAIPALAQLSDGARSLYIQRLADSAAGNYGGLPGSPLVVAPVPVLDTVVVWDRLRRETYPGNFTEYATYLRANPDWPQSIILRRQAEKSIDDSVPPADRIAYFRQFPPLSALAKLRFAEALLATGRGSEAQAMAQDAWDSSGLDVVAEAQLLALFDGGLTLADHLARADRLLWTGQTSAAARLLPRIDADHQALVLARIALRSGGPDAAARLAAVPAAQRNDAGLVLDRALWLKRVGRLGEAQALLGTADVKPGSMTDPEFWLKTRLDYARVAWRAGDFDAGYRIAARHNAIAPGKTVAERPLAERQAYIDSEWLAGWLALRKLNRAPQAIGHFRNVRAAALTPLSQARGDYWAGRAAESAGRAGEAKSAYEAAAVHFDYFYGQLAAERLGRALVINRPAAPNIPDRAAMAFRGDSAVRAAFALGDLGDHARQTIFLRLLADRADTVQQQALVASLVRPLNRPDVGVYAGKAARSDGDLALLDSAFPMLDLPVSLNPRWTMIHAISRQESQFDQGVISAANARGLMQLLPGTAAEQAAKLGLPVSTAQLTTDPVYNVTLGSAYFARLREGFSGSHVLAVAAYNAGAGSARKFIAMNGDPRTPGVDVIDWIEAIPYAETKTYVQRVLENAVVYDLLHPQTSVMPTTNRLSAYLGKSPQ